MNDRPMKKRIFNIRMVVIYQRIVYLFTSIAWPTSRRWRCLLSSALTSMHEYSGDGQTRQSSKPLPPGWHNREWKVLQSLFWWTDGEGIQSVCEWRGSVQLFWSFNPHLLRSNHTYSVYIYDLDAKPFCSYSPYPIFCDLSLKTPTLHRMVREWTLDDVEYRKNRKDIHSIQSMGQTLQNHFLVSPEVAKSGYVFYVPLCLWDIFWYDRPCWVVA